MDTFLLPLPIQLRAAQPTADVYRRRRLAAVGLLLVAAALAFVALDLLRGALDGGWGGGAAVDVAPVAEVSVVVEPGDTVWSIAESLARGADPRPVVDALVAANDGSAALVAGQRLALTVTIP